MIQKDIDALEREKSNDTRKCNILDVLSNVGSIFAGAYLRYKAVPKETIFEGIITDSIKLRRARFHEIKLKEQNINKEFFKS